MTSRQEVYETFFNAIKPLLAYCPTGKYLVHGDFGFDNVLSDGQHITGVLDWADARLGDFVYLAYLDFWSKDIPYGALWQEEAAAHRIAGVGNRCADRERTVLQEDQRAHASGRATGETISWLGVTRSAW